MKPRPSLAILAAATLFSPLASAAAEDDICSSMVGVGGDWVMQSFSFDETGKAQVLFARSFAEDYTRNGMMLAPSEKKVMGTPDAGTTYLTLLVQGAINPDWKSDINWNSLTVQISNFVYEADGTKPDFGWMSDLDAYAYLMNGTSQLAVTEAETVVTIFNSGVASFMDGIAEGSAEIRFCVGEKGDYSTCLTAPVGNQLSAAALGTAETLLRTRSQQFRETGVCTQ